MVSFQDADRFSKPYVGVTGIRGQGDLDVSIMYGTQQGIGRRRGRGLPYAIMIGMLTGPAVMGGEKHNSSTPHRLVLEYPELKSTLARAQQVEGVFPLVHFEFEAKGERVANNTISCGRTRPHQREDAGALIRLLQQLHGDGVFPGVQLNGVVPPDLVKKIRSEGQAPIVIQLRPEIAALPQADILGYLKSIKDDGAMVLLDPSGGTGTAFEVEPGLELYRAIVSELGPDAFQFGHAGGYGGTPDRKGRTEDTVRTMNAATAPMQWSVDVERGVRREDPVETDVISDPFLEEYFAACARAITSG